MKFEVNFYKKRTSHIGLILFVFSERDNIFLFSNVYPMAYFFWMMKMNWAKNYLIYPMEQKNGMEYMLGRCSCLLGQTNELLNST